MEILLHLLPINPEKNTKECQEDTRNNSSYKEEKNPRSGEEKKRFLNQWEEKWKRQNQHSSMQITETERERDFESKKWSWDRKLEEIVREAWTKSYRRKWHTQNRLVKLRRKTSFNEGISFCFFVSLCESRGGWKRSNNRCRGRGAFVDASKSSPRGGDACKRATERWWPWRCNKTCYAHNNTRVPPATPLPGASNGTSSGTLSSQR